MRLLAPVVPPVAFELCEASEVRLANGFLVGDDRP